MRNVSTITMTLDGDTTLVRVITSTGVIEWRTKASWKVVLHEVASWIK